MSSAKPAERPFDPSTTPAELSSSLTELESALSPLLSKEWAAQLEALSPLERAKTDVMVAYTIMKGVDPATHEVSPELERVRAYYTKIRKLENPEADARKYKVDVPAAGRFILNGIPQNQRLADPNTTSSDMPESSAAAAADAGRRQAMKEQQESIARLGKSGRMRFVAQEAERVVPGDEGLSGSKGLEEPMGAEESAEDLAEAEEAVLGGEEEEEEIEAVEVIEVDDDEGGGSDDFEMLDGPPGSGQRTPAEQAEALFADVEAGLSKAKRKRAEEF